MQKFLSYYSIRDENNTTMLEWTSLVWSHIPLNNKKNVEDLITCTLGLKYISVRSFSI